MPTKNAIANAVPVAKIAAASGVAPPADGWYFQVGVTDPRTILGWSAAPNLHDGAAGNTTNGYAQAPQGTGTSRAAWLAVKDAGMAPDNYSNIYGRANSGAVGPIYGANVWSENLANWTLLSFGIATNAPSGLDSFAWVTTSAGSGGGNPSYKYLVQLTEDSGGTVNQSGWGDIRLRNAGAVDVGPA